MPHVDATVRKSPLELLQFVQPPEFQAGSPADLMSIYANPIPSMTMCHVLGVPLDARHHFEHPNEVMNDPHEPAAERAKAAYEFAKFARSVIASKREAPGDDLLSELIPDENPRKNLFQRVGIKPAEAAKGDAKKKE